MEKIRPPTYEQAIAAGPTPQSATTNLEYISEGALQYVPTAPSISLIQADEAPLLSLAPLTDSELREVLFLHKQDLGCCGSKFIRGIILTDIKNDCAFHYKLESFSEKRECTPRFTAYYGQDVDGPENGSAPDKWNVPIGTPTMFINHQINTEVPHTSYIKECTTCEGEKKIDCTPCWASGMVSCRRCGGSGKNADSSDCWICRGSGKETCLKCSGRGNIDCSFCDGYGKVKYYMLLTVTWKNHVDEFISNRCNLPEDLILQASGKEIFTKQANQVEPLSTSHVTLNEASAVLIEKHHSSIRNQAVLVQRHSLRAVPFTRATYIWRNRKGEFYVYGFERKVYFEKYPQRCCWCACS